MWRWPARWALAGLLRLDEQRLGTFARLAIGSQVERMEGEIGMATGKGHAALDHHEATGTQQLMQAVGVVEQVMALAQAGQAHVLFAEGGRQQLDDGPDPRRSARAGAAARLSGSSAGMGGMQRFARAFAHEEQLLVLPSE